MGCSAANEPPHRAALFAAEGGRAKVRRGSRAGWAQHAEGRRQPSTPLEHNRHPPQPSPLKDSPITNAARETSSPFWRFRSSPRPTLRSSTGCGACCAAVLVRGDLRFLAPPSAPPGWAAHPLQPSSKEETARPADPAPALLTSAEGPPKGFLLRALGDRPEAAPSGPAFRLRTSGCCTGSDGGASASPNPPPATATSAAAASSAAAGWESSDGTAVFKVPDPSTEGSLRAEGEGGAPMTT